MATTAKPTTKAHGRPRTWALTDVSANAGSAASRSREGMDRPTTPSAALRQASGVLKTELTEVYPYLNGTLMNGTELWAMLGAGTGALTA